METQLSEIITKEIFDKQKVGLSGEFFVAAELLKRNFQVSLTFGNAKAVDIIAFKDELYPKKIQVKTLRAHNAYTVDKNKLLGNYFVFVILNKIGQPPIFYIIDGEIINTNLEQFYGSSIGSKRETINYGALKMYQDNWNVLE
ncbi:PDDEXK-like family protein [Elizabethkingia anophelis]|uniref:hypothetical protein n=1 Tax=Elizabethkingia anophelis TaxID=1117645 RepID=UPI0038929714|nr:hypothetical protein [Elizabethkingia anophelis]